jgi:hypothetical protein
MYQNRPNGDRPFGQGYPLIAQFVSPSTIRCLVPIGIYWYITSAGVFVRIATFVHQGQRLVGVVSPDQQTVTPFALSPAEAQRGALPLVEAAAAGQPLPATPGPALALSAVQLQAPIPRPRRNVWCVGRNYHEHAKELQGSVFKNNNANPAVWPIVFTKVPECVVGPIDTVQLPGETISPSLRWSSAVAARTSPRQRPCSTCGATPSSTT